MQISRCLDMFWADVLIRWYMDVWSFDQSRLFPNYVYLVGSCSIIYICHESWVPWSRPSGFLLNLYSAMVFMRRHGSAIMKTPRDSNTIMKGYPLEFSPWPTCQPNYPTCTVQGTCCHVHAHVGIAGWWVQTDVCIISAQTNFYVGAIRVGRPCQFEPYMCVTIWWCLSILHKFHICASMRKMLPSQDWRSLQVNGRSGMSL